MASAEPKNNSEEKRRRSQIQKLCLISSGRVSEEDATQLIDDCGGVEEAVRFLMLAKNEDVRLRLNQSPDYVNRLHKDADNVKKVLTHSKMDCQYGCEECNRMWWKRVPAHKPVSKCFRCRRKYDPIPLEHQWGWGEFQCDCGKLFTGFGIMSRTESRCYDCSRSVPMLRVIPPKKREEGGNRPRKWRHNCNGVNCYMSSSFHLNAEQPHAEKPPVCIHPRSRNPEEPTRIHWASNLHISTGSTIDTFLDQGSLRSQPSSLALSLETIPEEN